MIVNRSAGLAGLVRSKMNKDGSYSFNYRTGGAGGGAVREEVGRPGRGGSVTQEGSWSYTGRDGRLYTLSFVGRHSSIALPALPGGS